MNNIVTNFDQILEFAKSYGLPATKKRGILREYLQVKILDLIYQQKISSQLCFVGGTCLRLLYGLDRFSEDLDFDTVGFRQSQIRTMMANVYQRLVKENLTIDFYQNFTPKRAYWEFRFPNLLYELNLSHQKQEKLTIKFDFEAFWRGQKRKVVLLNRYGFLVNVVTIPLDQILVQKLFAYTKRKQTLPRDVYDIVWLTAQEAKLDKNFLKKNKLPKNLIAQAETKFKREGKKLKGLKLKLRPFLIDEKRTARLNLFPNILKTLQNHFN